MECWDGSSTCVRGPVWASPASTVCMLPSHSLHLSAQGRSWMVGMVIGDVPAKGMQAWGRGTQVVGRNAHN